MGIHIKNGFQIKEIEWQAITVSVPVKHFIRWKLKLADLYDVLIKLYNLIIIQIMLHSRFFPDPQFIYVKSVTEFK